MFHLPTDLREEEVKLPVKPRENGSRSQRNLRRDKREPKRGKLEPPPGDVSNSVRGRGGYYGSGIKKTYLLSLGRRSRPGDSA